MPKLKGRTNFNLLNHLKSAGMWPMYAILVMMVLLEIKKTSKTSTTTPVLPTETFHIFIMFKRLLIFSFILSK